MLAEKLNTKPSNGFEAEEVSLLINNLIDKKINAYKIEYMQNWERNHNFDSSIIDKKIKQLTQQKLKLKKQLEEAEKNNEKLDLKSIVELYLK